jgi:hypothetical protein
MLVCKNDAQMESKSIQQILKWWLKIDAKINAKIDAKINAEKASENEAKMNQN